MHDLFFTKKLRNVGIFVGPTTALERKMWLAVFNFCQRFWHILVASAQNLECMLAWSQCVLLSRLSTRIYIQSYGINAFPSKLKVSSLDNL